MRTLITGIISNENWKTIVLHLKAANLKSLQESVRSHTEIHHAFSCGAGYLTVR